MQSIAKDEQSLMEQDIAALIEMEDEAETEEDDSGGAGGLSASHTMCE